MNDVRDKIEFVDEILINILDYTIERYNWIDYMNDNIIKYYSKEKIDEHIILRLIMKKQYKFLEKIIMQAEDKEFLRLVNILKLITRAAFCIDKGSHKFYEIKECEWLKENIRKYTKNTEKYIKNRENTELIRDIYGFIFKYQYNEVLFKIERYDKMDEFMEGYRTHGYTINYMADVAIQFNNRDMAYYSIRKSSSRYPSYFSIESVFRCIEWEDEYLLDTALKALSYGSYGIITRAVIFVLEGKHLSMDKENNQYKPLSIIINNYFDYAKKEIIRVKNDKYRAGCRKCKSIRYWKRCKDEDHYGHKINIEKIDERCKKRYNAHETVIYLALFYNNKIVIAELLKQSWLYTDNFFDFLLGLCIELDYYNIFKIIQNYIQNNPNIFDSLNILTKRQFYKTLDHFDYLYNSNGKTYPISSYYLNRICHNYSVVINSI